jgi:hypothetical protein
MQQRAHGVAVGQQPFVTLRVPELFDLRGDPFERADRDSREYTTWRVARACLVLPTQGLVGQYLQTHVEFPPRQKPGSFALDQVLEKLQEGSGGKLLPIRTNRPGKAGSPRRGMTWRRHRAGRSSASRTTGRRSSPFE